MFAIFTISVLHANMCKLALTRTADSDRNISFAHIWSKVLNKLAL